MVVRTSHWMVYDYRRPSFLLQNKEEMHVSQINSIQHFMVSQNVIHLIVCRYSNLTMTLDIPHSKGSKGT